MSTRRTFIKGTAAIAALAVREPIANSSGGPNQPESETQTLIRRCKIPHTDLSVSRIAYGCANLAPWDANPITGTDLAKATRVIQSAFEGGITLYDHADLYAFGKAETVFGQVLKSSPGLRDKIVIQSKCGQRFKSGWKPGDQISVDLTHEHIMRSVEGSLRRLSTDWLDILLLHIVDTLVEPDEVARAFDELHRAGKVRYFGVSNYGAAQIQLLKKSVRQPLTVNQIHLGLLHPYPLFDGLEFTLEVSKGAAGDEVHPQLSGGGTFDYCRAHDIQIQAWSPLSGVGGALADQKPARNTAAMLLEGLSRAKEANPFAIALAWLLRHPAGIVPIVGSQDPKHILENCSADRIRLSHDEWYELLTAASELLSAPP